MSYVAVGWDQSVNKGATVVLDHNGALLDTIYLADKARDVKRKGCVAARIPQSIRKIKDPGTLDVKRLLWLKRWFLLVIEHIWEAYHGPLYVAVEDYAFAARGGGVHATGEVGGVLRCELMILGSRQMHLRLHDPLSLKFFVTGRGDATKQEVRRAVRERWDVDFDRYGDAAEDLYDAYGLARMCWTEVEVRAGRISLADLTDGERRVFLRTTKRYPTNLLDREWITGG